VGPGRGGSSSPLGAPWGRDRIRAAQQSTCEKQMPVTPLAMPSERTEELATRYRKGRHRAPTHKHADTSTLRRVSRRLAAVAQRAPDSSDPSVSLSVARTRAVAQKRKPGLDAGRFPWRSVSSCGYRPAVPVARDCAARATGYLRVCGEELLEAVSPGPQFPLEAIELPAPLVRKLELEPGVLRATCGWRSDEA
jgi:hypothetical protein